MRWLGHVVLWLLLGEVSTSAVFGESAAGDSHASAKVFLAGGHQVDVSPENP